MLAWMVYVVVVSLLLGLAALAAERSAQMRGAPARWLWRASIIASLALPAAISSVSIRIPILLGAAGRFTPPDFPLRLFTAGALQPSAWLDTTIGPLGRAPSLDVLLAWAWLAVSAFILLVILGNGALILRRKRSWEGRTIAATPVFVSEDVGPAVVGLLRPCIVIPRWIAESTPETQALVLAHERSHLEANDVRLLAVAILLIVTMPWNLPLWWQLRRLRFAIEVDCDRRVLNAGHDVGRYGETLIVVAERQSRRIGIVAAMSESKSSLEQRISKMVSKPKKLAWVGATALAALAFVLAASAAEVSPPNASPIAPAAPAARHAGPALADISFRLVDDAPDAAQKARDERVTSPDGGELWLAPQVEMTGSMFASARVAHGRAGHPVVNFALTPEGKRRFSEVTRQNVGRRLALLVNDEVRWAPRIRAEIDGGVGQIDGHFTQDQAETLAREITPARR